MTWKQIKQLMKNIDVLYYIVEMQLKTKANTNSVPTDQFICLWNDKPLVVSELIPILTADCLNLLLASYPTWFHYS